jgi:progesterone-induced-blocking factor 1
MEDKVDRLEQSLLDAKKQAEKYMDRVLNANDDIKSKFENQYSNEIQELKDRQAKELELAKSTLVDIYERRVDDLRDRKDDLERRNHKLEADLRDKTKSYEDLIFEFRQLQKTGDEEMGHLKLDVRSKQDAVNRIQHLYEDNLLLVKETKLENEALRAKLDILKSEYYKLESTARQGSADIKAELAVAKERLANYEMIEKELDQAIMHVAENDQIQGEGAFDIGNALIQTITSAPTTAKRRI